MNINVRVPPPPGTAAPGDLYIDMPTKQLWLGVPVGVNPDGAELIVDQGQLEADIAGAEDAANNYTDTQLLTRAPVVHTHLAADITDFEAAVAAALPPGSELPVNTILLWYGLPGDVGQGSLADWHVCDGTGGTPDLRDRFIIGAGGGKVHKSSNALGSTDTDDQGSHSHTGFDGYYALAVADLPSHTHGPGSLSGYISGGVTSSDSHNHTVSGPDKTGAYAIGAGGPPAGYSNNVGSNIVRTTSSDSHSHTVTGTIYLNGGTSAYIGSGTSHRHSISPDGLHHHALTSQKIRDTIPYYALLYIMKVS
jgi:hypothetical protein